MPESILVCPYCLKKQPLAAGSTAKTVQCANCKTSFPVPETAGGSTQPLFPPGTRPLAPPAKTSAASPPSPGAWKTVEPPREVAASAAPRPTPPAAGAAPVAPTARGPSAVPTAPPAVARPAAPIPPAAHSGVAPVQPNAAVPPAPRPAPPAVTAPVASVPPASVSPAGGYGEPAASEPTSGGSGLLLRVVAIVGTLAVLGLAAAFLSMNRSSPRDSSAETEVAEKPPTRKRPSDEPGRPFSPEEFARPSTDATAEPTSATVEPLAPPRSSVPATAVAASSPGIATEGFPPPSPKRTKAAGASRAASWKGVNVASFAASRDGKILATLTRPAKGIDATIRVWDTASGAQLRAIRVPNNDTWFLLSPDGKRVAAMYFQRGKTRLAVWDASGDGPAIRSWVDDTDGNEHWCFRADGQALLTIAGRRPKPDDRTRWQIAVWDLTRDVWTERPLLAEDEYPLPVLIPSPVDPNALLLISSDKNEAQLRFFDGDRETVVRTPDVAVRFAAVSGDGTTIVASGAARAAVWSWPQKKLVGSYELEAAGVTGEHEGVRFAASTDGRFAAAPAGDWQNPAVLFLETATGKLFRQPAVRFDEARFVDGSTLLIAADRGGIDDHSLTELRLPSDAQALKSGTPGLPDETPRVTLQRPKAAPLSPPEEWSIAVDADRSVDVDHVDQGRAALVTLDLGDARRFVVFDLQTLEKKAEWTFESERTVLSPDGRYFAATRRVKGGPGDHEAVVWELPSGRVKHTLRRGEDAQMYDLAQFSADSTKLWCFGVEPGHYEMTTGKFVARPLRGNSVHLLPPRAGAAFSSQSGSPSKVFAFATPEDALDEKVTKTWTTPVMRNYNPTMVATPDTKRFVTFHEARVDRLLLWSWDQSAPLRAFELAPDLAEYDHQRLEDLTISDDGRFLAFSLSGVNIVDLESGRLGRIGDSEHSVETFLPTGELVISSRRGKIYFFDILKKSFVAKPKRP